MTEHDEAQRDPARGNPAQPWPTDPLKAILGFHGRIRAALRSLDDLGEQVTTGDADPIVAQALYDFFTGPLVWHDFDEETSLMPRLRRVKHPTRLEKIMATISEAHDQMETTIEDLCPHLLTLARGGDPDAERIVGLGVRLRELLEPHMRLEEQEIVPLARLLLTADDLREIAVEMAERLKDRQEHVQRAPELVGG